jgi:FkbM family methyltransferase
MTMRVIEGRHGSFLCQDNDRYIGRSLVAYGEYSEGEVTLFRQILRPGDTVVEAGANIGALTVPIAELVGAAGSVFAFEPQRLIYNMLCGNLALNAIENTHAFAMAVGDRAGQVRVPVVGYGSDANYGGIVAGAADAGEAVSVGTVDSLKLPRLDFLKADVEGAEEFVLRGAEETIRRDWPTLYLENDRRERSPALLAHLFDLGYEAWWHLPPLFNPDNRFGNRENLFGAIASLNILCQHARRTRPVPELRKVSGIDEWPL